MIFIDADACPVTDIVIDVASIQNKQVRLVKSYAHFSHKRYPEFVKEIYVDSASEAADYRIMSLIQKGDVLVTQDYGLASLALTKEAKVIHPSGNHYSTETINRLLESRYLNQQLRKSGAKTKGPRAFTERDRAHFKAQFQALF
ncbi:hypothetical protein DES38_104270 [Streptohalobacillus salinus]|uniref:UPF0178 protein DES38_104270 n=1 Tax=Streptohalobacillus salinus TaxID=621096 RepID=A0A2V3WF99_9BACI|nr:YaiI/YqxD family protein [Streptohalobacillus salinus]PXW91834.1 hypothetical protein DES38_104270 [Streptohalobacillus salinus]